MDNFKYLHRKPTQIINNKERKINLRREVNEVFLEHLYSINITVTHGEWDGPNAIMENGEVTINVSASDGYVLPNSVIVNGASYTYDKAAGTIVLSNPTASVEVAVACLEVFSISVSVTNGSYSGDQTIVEEGSASVTLSANEGYVLPDSVSVSGATSSYNSGTGVVGLSNPTGNVSVTAVCEQDVDAVLANNSWEKIRQVCEAGNAGSYWSLGDTKQDVGSDSVTRTFRICDMQGLYSKHVVFEQVEQEATAAVWNPSDNLDDDNCYNDYNISNMRTTVLPALLANYSSGLSGQITNTTYKVAKNGTSLTILDLTDKLFLPAEKEIFGSASFSITGEADALTWFALYQTNNTESFRIKYRSGSAMAWWERSPYIGYTNFVCLVGSNGVAVIDLARGSSGVAPCFSF